MAHLGEHRHVAVIGAGWAGLAAAVTLAERGIPVTVFESSRHLGGRARRLTIEGIDLDNGQHILIGAYGESLRLMRMVGADPERSLLRTPLEFHLASGFRLRAPRLPPPFNLLVGMFCASGISVRERLAAARFIVRQRRTGYRLPRDEAVADWLAACGQSARISAALWAPLCTAALNTPPARASAQVFLNVLHDTIEGGPGASDLLLPRADLGALFPEPASRFVMARGGTIHVGTPVRHIGVALDGVRINNGEQRFSHAVVACAPQHAGALLRTVDGLQPLADKLDSLEYEPIYTCYLQYRPAHTLPRPMLGFSNDLVHWAFDRGQLSGHHGLIACVISGSGEHEAMSSADLAAAAHAQLARCVAELPAPLWSRVIAEKRATFSCRPGLARPVTATTVTRLRLAGDYTASRHPATLESAIRSGVAAARSILETY
jgi:hydroxysqualene dehydroxylase